MRVLVAITSQVDRERICALLVQTGHVVEAVDTRDAALARGTREPFDLTVLDPTMDVLEALRLARPGMAILLVTEPGDVDARVLGLTPGVDEAVGADVAGSQMVARVGALHRRLSRAPRPLEVLEVDGCRIDLGALTATRGNLIVQLGSREVGILRWLHTHRERVVSQAELLEQVWGCSPNLQTRTVDVAISMLRTKLEVDPAEPRVVRSVRGAGYRWGG